MRALFVRMSSRLYDSRFRTVEAGRLATDRPGRHSVAGRMGRGVNPPPQFGQTFCSVVSTQSTQNVHSYEQIRASVDAGGRSRSQHSQLGRSSSAIFAFPRPQLSHCDCSRKDENPAKSDMLMAGTGVRLHMIFRLFRRNGPVRLNVAPNRKSALSNAQDAGLFLAVQRKRA